MQRRETLYGWAKVTRDLLESLNLQVCLDNAPYCGHTTIRGWPEEKNAQLDKQKILAQAACRVVL